MKWILLLPMLCGCSLNITFRWEHSPRPVTMPMGVPNAPGHAAAFESDHRAMAQQLEKSLRMPSRTVSPKQQ